MLAFIHWFFRGVFVAVLLTLLGAQPAWAQPSSAIRVLDRRLAGALRDTLERSPTLQSIVAELEQSDVIVHVTATPSSARHPHSGRLAFVTAAGGRRFVRITIDSHLSHLQHASLLGHELFHALEVAHEPSVVDQAAFASFYRRVGRSSDHGWLCFDTAGAQDAGQRVLAEVASTRPVRTTDAHPTTAR